MSNNYIINLYKLGKISYLTLSHELGNSKAELIRDTLTNQTEEN